MFKSQFVENLDFSLRVNLIYAILQKAVQSLAKERPASLLLLLSMSFK